MCVCVREFVCVSGRGEEYVCALTCMRVSVFGQENYRRWPMEGETRGHVMTAVSESHTHRS